MAAASGKKLELRLMEAGTRLVEPPSSVDELIPLLDKVAVAACISEITRITAPVDPYEDDQMRVFENIDYECFVKDHHPETISASMATIMTLVLLESGEASVELLSAILASVKRDDEEVHSVARGLALRVLENCGSKFKPNLMQAVQNSGISFDDYSSVVASICQVAPSAVVDQNDIVVEKCEVSNLFISSGHDYTNPFCVVVLCVFSLCIICNICGQRQPQYDEKMEDAAPQPENNITISSLMEYMVNY
ncbi:hypothetical protein V6N12_004728 [Hibiscus sabdariffa]|uniref:Uncharacterized protein n=1 Tax=Hibiscus sabdariffa TaxID=183260 RepID=A0ABR2CMC5_9ROSI